MAERTSRSSPSCSVVNVTPNEARSVGRGMPGMAPSEADGERYGDALRGQLNAASRCRAFEGPSNGLDVTPKGLRGLIVRHFRRSVTLGRLRGLMSVT